MTRWTVTVLYRSETGPCDVIHDIEEIADLHDLIELGPHWDAIEQITIRRAGGEQITVEEAARR